VACTESYNGSTWTAKTAMNTARYGLAGAGTQTAALGFGGYTGFPTYIVLACTESYNITSYNGIWTTGGVIPVAKTSLAGAGGNTNAVLFGGALPAVTGVTSEYNGTAWTAGATMATARCSLAGAGTQLSAVATGGFTTVCIACTELYTKTFSIVNTLSTNNLYGTIPATNIVNDSVACVTAIPGIATNPTGVTLFNKQTLTTPSTDGFSSTSTNADNIFLIATAPKGVWTSGGTMNQARYILAGVGTNTAALAFGGNYVGIVACTESYNGTSWTAGGVMNTAKSFLAGAGTNTAALAFGGFNLNPEILANTESYNLIPVIKRIITT